MSYLYKQRFCNSFIEENEDLWDGKESILQTDEIIWTAHNIFKLLDVDKDGYIGKRDLMNSSHLLGIERDNHKDIKLMISEFSTHFSGRLLNFQDFCFIFRCLGGEK